MPKMSTNANLYFVDGCGRCKFGGTPDCKVHSWTDELQFLRQLALDSGLVEESKWGVPCYTHNNKNVLIVSAFKDYCALSFFKGVLLKDSHQILIQQGENSQSARIVKVTKDTELTALAPILKSYIDEAIAVEQSGAKVVFKEHTVHDLPIELIQVLDEDPGYHAAFFALTPGRQRGYAMHFAQPKKVETRLARIERCRDKIFDGIGLNEY